VVIGDVQTLTFFAELTGLMGRGEAACLSLAITQNWLTASGEKRTFRREALARLGTDRLINTPGLLLLSIRAHLITIEEADAMKALLEQRRFRMKFGLFETSVDPGVGPVISPDSGTTLHVQLRSCGSTSSSSSRTLETTRSLNGYSSEVINDFVGH
jgi:hypothetical protein